jgi:hypothetical protein
MAYFLNWLKLIILVFLLRQSDAVSDQNCTLNNEISRLEGHVLKILTELEYRNETLVSKCYVTGLQNYIVICSQMSLSGFSIVLV